MEADDLTTLLTQCPLRIEMNSGAVYTVEKPEFIVVSDYQAAILVEFEGVKRIVIIGLMNISSVVPYGQPAQP